MNDLVFNVLPAQGPIIPLWIPLLGGFPINSPLVGSFLGVFLGFAVNWIWQFLSDKHLKFEEEYHIKAEFSRIGHDLDPKIGGKSHPIRTIYGADHVRKYRLFGEYRTQVINWYNGFEKYNSSLEDLNERRNNEDPKSIASEFNQLRNSKHNGVIGILRSNWLKKIPDDLNNSNPFSNTKFIWYLLKQDALKEPTRKGDFRNAAVDAIGRANDKLANLDCLLAGAKEELAGAKVEANKLKETMALKNDEVAFLRGHVSQLTQSINQFALKPGEEEIKRKGWWRFWR